ncbi:transglycosylase domain-containing protein [Heyndrickxia acidicola]|uniref:PBP1A family penicillin-binding protein n=1 Tax=Heyndrickxia acidicola TaxID=209389 RepID=A0ABU6MFS0_9BACI|nr:PBP1A family penicillin-binding protein [Heyndrickxia acidicola]MED1202881.1 PBP1A family penicillin-binding protein [Heyndrickxia acidicola]
METMTHPKNQKPKRYTRLLILAILLLFSVIAIFVLAVLIYAKILGPPPLAVPQSTLYYSDNGTLIGESDNGQKRYWVPLKDISQNSINSTLSIEDKNFYYHHGFDFKRMAGAILTDAIARKKVQGASTITQQYARNLFLTMDKTWTRKISEAFYTIRLEMNYSKNQILEGYLNTINYGHGAYGIQAASQLYFGKDASNLTLGEAAMLAGIPKGPSIYSPLDSYEKAKKRQVTVLHSMFVNGFITKKEALAAAQQKITIKGQFPVSKERFAPYFQDVVKQELKTKLGLDERTIALGGLKVYTTLDINQQKIAENVVKDTISNQSAIQLGFVAMDPSTGNVTALIGGRNYQASPYNRAVQALRQPGSTIKPMLYYAALNNGFTPVTMMKSAPTTFHFDNGKAEYTPHNFNNEYADGDITLAQALALSDNIYAVKTNLFLGPDTLVKTAKQFGITTKMKAVPSLALGTSGVHVLDMVHAYSLLANGGKEIEPTFIRKVVDSKGKVLYESEPEKKQILNKDNAFVMTQMMTGIFDKRLNGYGTVTGASIVGQTTRPYAGKSGSTNTDSWMIGFAPQLTAGVWTGYDNGGEITLTADKLYAKKIWVSFMEKALQDKPIQMFNPPKGVIGLPIDLASGKLAAPECSKSSRLMYFVKGTQPTETCSSIKTTGKDGKHTNKKTKSWLNKLFHWF